MNGEPTRTNARAHSNTLAMFLLSIFALLGLVRGDSHSKPVRARSAEAAPRVARPRVARRSRSSSRRAFEIYVARFSFWRRRCVDRLDDDDVADAICRCSSTAASARLRRAVAGDAVSTCCVVDDALAATVFFVCARVGGRSTRTARK